MAKQKGTSKIYNISSSEDELDLDVSTDKLEKINIKVEENNSNDNNILSSRRKRANVIESGENVTSFEKVEDNVSSSEEWEDIAENISLNLPARINFSVHPQTIGPQIPSNIREPIDYFTLYFTNELLDSIIKETNHYANEKIRNKQLSHKSIWHNWYDVDRQEFLAFIAVILNMGIIQVSNLRKYWSTASNSKTSFFPETFSRERFMQIFWMLHLKTPALGDGTIRTRIQKANNYLEYIDSKFSQYFIPDQAICVEESVIKFKGKISFKTYNPNKSKWSTRIYALADSKTGYLFSILPYYYGSITSENILRPDLLISTRIPLHLYKKLLEKVPNAVGYHMFTDRYYTSIILAKELLKMKCYLTGIIKVNQKEIPTQIQKPIKFLTKKTVAYRKNDLTPFSWKDKRIVAMLSTWNAGMKFTTKTYDQNIISVNKPKRILNYIANMSGVDHANQYASAYCFLQKPLKWWRKLFFWGLEICVINSYILYRASKEENNEKPMTRLKFVKLLIDQLRGDFRE